MRRSLNSSAPSATNAPLTRAQLQAAIESEERRQGLAPDSLVSETTVEEAARKLGISPDELREKALQAPSVAVKPARTASPLWTPFNRKLFTFGIVLAVALTGLEGFSRLSIGKNLQAQWEAAQRSRPSVYSPPKFSPIDAHFKSLLAQTVGPNPTLRMIALENQGWTNGREEEFFRIAGVPDGYDLFTLNSYGSRILGSNYSTKIGVVFRPFHEAPQKNEQAMSPWRYVRLGDRWYARGWIPSETLREKFAETNNEPYVTLREELSSTLTNNADEIVFPAEFIDGPQMISFQRTFRPDPALLAATKEHGEFRWAIPTSIDTPAIQMGGMEPELLEFVSSGFSVSSNLIEVSKIKEGAPIRVTANMLQLLQNGRTTFSQGRESVAIRQIDFRPEVKGDWTLVRYGKKLYLRGWIAGPVNKEALIGKNLLVCNTPENAQMGYQPTKITLPVERMMSRGSRPEWGATAAFTGVALDEHAWEKW